MEREERLKYITSTDWAILARCVSADIDAGGIASSMSKEFLEKLRDMCIRRAEDPFFGK